MSISPVNRSVLDLPTLRLDRESEQEKPTNLDGWPAVIREPYEPTVTPEPKNETDSTYQ